MVPGGRDDKTVTQLAQVGVDDDKPEVLDLTSADKELGRGATGITIRTGAQAGPQHCTDPFPELWRQVTRQARL